MALAPKKKKIIISLIAGIIIVATGYWFLHRNEETTDDASIEAHISPISAKVSGYIENIYISDNQKVKKGALLLTINPIDYDIARNHAEAALNAAQARFDAQSKSLESTKISAPSGAISAQAQLDSAESNWQRAADVLKRLQKTGDLATSRVDMDNAISAEKTARSALEDAKARLRTANTAPITVAAATSSLGEYSAALQEAKTDLIAAEQHLDDCMIIAPIDGKITKRGAEIGTYVQPGQQLLSIVGNNYWVIANFKETQLKSMHPGQVAEIHLDAYPGKHLYGRVESIQSGTGAHFSSFPPENATGNFVKIVQRVPVKILFEKPIDPAFVLGPGMSAEVTVLTK